MSANWLSPALKPGLSGDRGQGVFVRQDVPRGAVVAVWGGRIVSREEAAEMPDDVRRYCVQVEDDLFLAALQDVDPAELINHSCDANTGLVGQLVLVALRDLVAGDEVTYDYATSDASDFLEFDCACGSAACRGRVRATDWERPDVQQRYAGYFSPYLQRRIAAGGSPAAPV